MKVALVTDTHFGARSDSLAFDTYFAKFYDETFFPYLKEHDIKTVCHLGDIFDRRKYINFNTLKSCKRYFFKQAEDLGIDIHMIPGNHDTYFKNTNDVNSPDLLLGEYNNITLYQEPTEIMLDREKVLYLPWICGENYDRTMAKIKESDAKTCFGHFEFAGYFLLPGMPNLHGMDTDAFNDFDLVVSGHFHHRHSRGNITYMGNPYEITWSDYKDPRGFAIYDTVDRALEYINNPFRIFHKIYYDDSHFEGVNDISNFNFDSVSGGSVKLIVSKKTDYARFDHFVDKLYTYNLIDLKIIEDFSEFEDEALGEDIDLEDTMTLLKEYVDVVETDLDKQRIKNLLQSLYVEAQDTL
jgi:DNA repair exonuclease SbcCD nuclease subunit